MYIVKRPFRNYGIVYTVGTVITEPDSIKHFKSRVREGKILAVKPSELEQTRKYFFDKFGVTIEMPSDDVKQAAPQQSVKKATAAAKPLVKPSVQPIAKPVAKPVAKATATTVKQK